MSGMASGADASYTFIMTRIGIDARLVAYQSGGISAYIKHLINAIESLEVPETFAIFESRSAQDPLSSRYRGRKLLTPPHHRLERLALSVELFPDRLDLLHSPDFIPPFRGARRHVITVHDLAFLHYPEQKDAASRRYYNNQISLAVAHADHILAVSSATKQDLTDMLGVAPEKITVQQHGVAPGFLEISEERLRHLRAELGLPREFILHVGSFEPRKNIPTLLKAYRELAREKKDPPPLALVGRQSWLFNDTRQTIAEMQQENIPIIVREDIDDATLPSIYNLALALVFPSFYEGFGLPALEAMACGTPVIVSDIPAFREVVEGAGLFCDPNDWTDLAQAIGRAISDSEWRTTARTAGLKRAQNFTWKASAEKALHAYRVALEN